MVTSMGQYLAQSDSTENIIVHFGSPEELKLVAAFRKGITVGRPSAYFREMNVARSGADSLKNALSPIGRNNVIFLTNNEVRLASLLRKMSNWLEETYIVGFAPEAWFKFGNIEMDIFEKFRIHRPAAFHIEYGQLPAQYFVQRFRETFKTEPSTFAFRGYDLAMHLGQNLAGITANGLMYLEAVEDTGLQSNFRWKRINDGGLENVGCRIVDYTDYELKLATD